jgi:hypothetical protein
MYPIEEAQITVGKELSIAYPVSWDGTLDRLRQLRAADRPPADLYYYGLLKPTDTFRAYCGSGCTAGIGYVGAATQAATRVAMGLAFADEVSASTMAHELGHNHGRNHAPCAPGNRISGVDSKYPYQRAITNTWGYDERKQTLFSPDKTTDIMGYCEPKWISDYTYKALIERVASLNGATLTFYANTNEQAYRVLLVDESGPRWSQPFTEPAEPFGDAEYADALDIDGQVVESIQVYRTLLGDHPGSTILVPPPKQGWNAVRTADGMALAFSAPVAVEPLH